MIEARPHGYTRETLLRREGLGPWVKDYDHSSDYNQNNANRYRLRRVFKPDPSSISLADRSFFRVFDLSYKLFGQEHRFDLFTRGSELALPGQQPGETIEQWDPVSLYSIDIGRLLRAQSRGHQGSTDALVALHNTAKQGGKTAFIYAHGTTDSGQWLIDTDSDLAPADEICCDVSSPLQVAGSGYQLTYLTACNEDGVALDMNRVGIPVIANLAINSVFGGSARLYFPEDQVT